MCIIIQRKPNFEIPYHKFETSILNNPDGFGLSFAGDKGLTVLRSPKKPDPEKLYKMVNEELIDKNLMLHLRYTTAGETNLRNAHPFPILEKRKDGIDLRMCHNGTLYPYKDKAKGGESDTRVFVREFVRPLFKRLARGMEPEEMLNDSFVKEILEDKLSTMSVLTFMDSEENTLICNEEGNGGKQEDEWYYSNTYSFDPKHRAVSVPAKKHYPSGGQGKTSVTTTGTSGSSTSVLQSAKFATDCKTRKFTEKFKLKSIQDTLLFTDETIDAIINAGGKGENASLLIKELLLEVKNLKVTNSKLYRENCLLKGEKR